MPKIRIRLVFCVIFKIPPNLIGSQYEKLIIQKLNVTLDIISDYKETLESIKKGVLYSKDDGDGDTYSMIPPTEDVVSSYSVDVTKDNGKTVHIGDYSTVEELDKAISDAVKNGQLTQEEADSVQK